MSPKRQSILRRSKKTENRVSRYLFGHDRLWKEREDIGNLEWCGEVKDYTHRTIGDSGGAWKVLRTALEQTMVVCGDRKPFSVLHIKSTPVEQCLVMYDGMVIPIPVFKERYIKTPET